MENANRNPKLRSEGSAHSRADRRELGRVGVGRDGVVPTQAEQHIYPAFFGANYRLSIPIRPSSIEFDNGFLDLYSKRKPTSAEIFSLAQWRAKLAAARIFRPDLTDAIDAYQHFLDGDGAKRIFSYDKYVLNDISGRKTLANAMLDIQDGVEVLYKRTPDLENFSLTGGAIHCNDRSGLFPYPQTENWQKAIGGHIIWLSGKVAVKNNDGKIWFNLDMTLNAEDRYNFNPGQKDIATNIPDNENGIFEITGLAQQYDQFSTLKRRISWQKGTLSKPSSSNVDYLRA
ncbi:hypothetical protein [Marinomonas gallaica]|uniref:hypothetical protein n=1 Tax=Marinomonas gallaica TaxID=1806667 RepID=UPI003A8F8BE4